VSAGPRPSSASGAAESRAAAVVADRWGEHDTDVLTLVRMLIRAGASGHAGIDLSLPPDELLVLLEVEAGGPEDRALRSALGAVDRLVASPAVAQAPLPSAPAAGDPARPLLLTVEQRSDGTRRTLLQTERAARFEHRIVAALGRRGPRPGPDGARGTWTSEALDLLERLLGDVASLRARGLLVSDEQLAAVRTLLTAGGGRRFAILSGGPGTGKTTTVATLLALLVAAGHRVGEVPRIALAAPTGRARSRLIESIRRAGVQVERIADHLVPGEGTDVRSEVLAIRAATVHGLLGIGRDGVARRSAGSLAYDVIVVDETSMLDLPLAADLLDAAADDALVVFVGDPDQLESVGTGSVLGSLIRGLTAERPDPVAKLTTDHRTDQGDASAQQEAVRRADIVQAVREGDADRVLERLAAPPADGTPMVEWIRVGPGEDPTALATKVVAPLLDGLREARRLAMRAAGEDLVQLRAAIDRLDEVRLLCGHRAGRWGVTTWNSIVREAVLADGEDGAGGPEGSRWVIGEPVIMTVNDRRTGLSNGDVGILAAQQPRLLAFRRPPRPDLDAVDDEGSSDLLLRRAVTLVDVQSANAITVHRAQGSEYGVVVVLLPPHDSPLANRQLLYTALTRAKQRVVLVATERAVRTAVGRSVRRMGGLEGAVRRLTSGASG